MSEKRQKRLRKRADQYVGAIFQEEDSRVIAMSQSLEDLVLSGFTAWVWEFSEEEAREAIRWVMKRRGIVEGQQPLF